MATVSPRSYEVDEKYMELFRRFPLLPIRSDEHLGDAIAIIDELVDRAYLSSSEEDYLNVLADLVERYESEHIIFPPGRGIDMLRHLMEANDMEPSDLVPFLDGESAAAEVLSEQRPLSLSEMKRLAHRFGLPIDVFVDE